MSLSAKILAQVGVHQTGSNDLGTSAFDTNPSLQPLIELLDGTGNNQASKCFADTRTIGASSSENLDLAGSLVDAFGNVITFATIKAIYVRAAAGNINDVQIGAAGANTFVGVFGDATDLINVKPGGVFLWVAPKTGVAVTPTTGDILKVANSGAGSVVTYDIIILGI